jgi:hypothetical protein
LSSEPSEVKPRDTAGINGKPQVTASVPADANVNGGKPFYLGLLREGSIGLAFDRPELAPPTPRPAQP